MKKRIYVASAIAAALLAWEVPVPVGAVHVTTYGSRTDEYDTWGGIRVDDTNCDNNDVYSDYKRDSGTPNVLRNSLGCNGGNEESGTSSNKIQRFNSCTDDAGPNTCSGTVYR